jgi:hypothetical protein
MEWLIYECSPEYVLITEVVPFGGLVTMLWKRNVKILKICEKSIYFKLTRIQSIWLLDPINFA